MKAFAILATFVSVCVAFTAAFYCCPDPPLPIGLGPSCVQCKKHPSDPKMCCPVPPMNPRFGHGPACKLCDESSYPAPPSTCDEPPSDPEPPLTDPIPPCCPNPPLHPIGGHGPVCTPCAKALET